MNVYATKSISLVLTAAMVLLCSAAARAHDVQLESRSVAVNVDRKHLHLRYETAIDKQYLPLLGVTSGLPERMTVEEEARLAQAVVQVVLEKFAARRDGEVMPLQFDQAVVTPRKDGAHLRLDFSAPLEGAATVTVIDATTHTGWSGPTQFTIAPHPRFTSATKLEKPPGVTLKIAAPGAGPDVTANKGNASTTTGAMLDRPAGDASTMASPESDANADRPADHSDALSAYLEGDITLGVVLAALVVAFFMGAVHALGPGHGKAMVAAYLVGTRGRIRDAVALGGIVTFTHIFSVVIIGIVALLLSAFILPQTLMPWLTAASGLLVVGVGFWLLARMAIRGQADHHHHGHAHGHEHPHPHDHDHDHAHDHDHSHSHDHSPEQDHHHGHNHSHDHGHSHVPEGPITLGSLISLGVAGGMVPCPTALVVLLVAVALNRIVLGLSMILTFSLGLAAVLILIGILTVTASRFTARFEGNRWWIRRLPIASSAVIMLVGLAIILRAAESAGYITIHV